MEGRETLTIVLSKGAIMAPMLVMISTILRYSLSFSKRFAPELGERYLYTDFTVIDALPTPSILTIATWPTRSLGT
jgi:hypothetical protein